MFGGPFGPLTVFGSGRLAIELVDRVHRCELACEQVLDRRQHEPLLLEQRLARECGGHDGDRVVTAAPCDLDHGIWQALANGAADRFFDGAHEVGRMIAQGFREGST